MSPAPVTNRFGVLSVDGAEGVDDGSEGEDDELGTRLGDWAADTSIAA